MLATMLPIPFAIKIVRHPYCLHGPDLVELAQLRFRIGTFRTAALMLSTARCLLHSIQDADVAQYLAGRLPTLYRAWRNDAPLPPPLLFIEGASLGALACVLRLRHRRVAPIRAGSRSCDGRRSTIWSSSFRSRPEPLSPSYST